MAVEMKVFPNHYVYKVDFVINDAPRKVEHFVAGSMKAVFDWMEPVATIYSIELVYKEDGIRVIAEF